MEPIFRSSDGKEHDTKADAEVWEVVVVAYGQYQEATIEIQNLIAAFARTADGRRFMRKKRHWRVRYPHRSMPYLEEISVDWWSVTLKEWDGELTERAQIETDQRDYKGARTGNRIAVDIGDLYRDHDKAKAALRVEQLDVLEEWQEKLGVKP